MSLKAIIPVMAQTLFMEELGTTIVWVAARGA